jgi:Ca2+-binding RTX toxin-like protein
MGAGDDTFVWNPGDDSDVVEGQAGADLLLFNGSNVAENIALAANGGRVSFFRDVAGVTMDLDDVETVRFVALGGADTISIGDLTGTDAKTIIIDLRAAGGTGDGQIDTVFIGGTNGEDAIAVATVDGIVKVTGLTAEVQILGFESTDKLVINSLAGDDVVDASNLDVGIVFHADGGNDDDVLIGGDGADTLIGGLGDDVLIGGPGIDVLDGGAGTNIIIA